MLLDSLRLGEVIMLNIDPKYPGGYIAFNIERMRDHSKNGEWFVDFRITYDGPSTFVYLSTHTRKAIVVDEKFRFSDKSPRVLTDTETLFLCHLTEFKSPEINKRILNCFINSAHCSKSANIPAKELREIKKTLEGLVDFFKIFNKKPSELFPIVQKLISNGVNL